MSIFSKFMSKKYKATAYCYNCHARIEVQIDKGKTIAEGIVGAICENCGCHTLTADKEDTIAVRNRQIAETRETQRMMANVPPRKKMPPVKPIEEEVEEIKGEVDKEVVDDKVKIFKRPPAPDFWRN